MNLRLPILAAMGALLLAGSAQAQLELSPATPFNALTENATKFGSTNPIPLSQFSSVGITSGGVVPGAQAVYKDSQELTCEGAAMINLRNTYCMQHINRKCSVAFETNKQLEKH